MSRLYGEEMVEELEFAIRTWDDLERDFAPRKRRLLADNLCRRGRQDLTRKVHLATYGTSKRGEIKAARNR